MSITALPEWFRAGEDSFALLIHATPGAKVNAIAGVHDGRLKIRIAAKPEGGKANKVLCRYIASILGCSLSNVSLVKGGSSRSKALGIAEVDQSDAIELLRAFL